MLPEFLENGNLPPGLYPVTLEYLFDKYGYHQDRLDQLNGFVRGMRILGTYGVEKFYLNGSFITTKEYPGDFDCCWGDDEISDVELERMEWENPEFFMLDYPREEQKDLYEGEFWPASTPVEDGLTIFELFQTDAETKESKGILLINYKGE